MPLPLKNTRNVSRTVQNSMKKDSEIKNKSNAKGQKVSNNSNSKRSAESSPECGPSHKRSVLGDLTNAVSSEVTTTVEKENKRITRSQSGASLKQKHVEPIPLVSSQPESRKSKRLSDTKENVERDRCRPISSSQESNYETADESASLSPKWPSVAEITDEPGQSVPKGVDDFDLQSASDPFAVSLYAQDIFKHFKQREVKFLPEKYLRNQRDISKGMRSILVDWLAEVQESFELNHETLYLSVKLVDLFLTREVISKQVLQLLGATSLFVAAKFDERSPPVIDDFLYICDDAYDRRQLLRMEIKILKTIDFDLGIPLSYTFLRRYARCSKQTMELLTLARYVLELSLLEYEMIDVPDSLIAAASLSLALQMKKMEPWNSTLEYYSGYTLTELTDLVHRLNALLTTVGQKNLNTIPNKYNHKVFFEVAKIPPLDLLST